MIQTCYPGAWGLAGFLLKPVRIICLRSFLMQWHCCDIQSKSYNIILFLLHGLKPPTRKQSTSTPWHPTSAGTRVCCGRRFMSLLNLGFSRMRSDGSLLSFQGVWWSSVCGSLHVAHNQPSPRAYRNCTELLQNVTFEIVICISRGRRETSWHSGVKFAHGSLNRHARCASSECCKTWRFWRCEIAFRVACVGLRGTQACSLARFSIDWLAVSSRFATRVWSMECEVWSAEREIWCVEWRVWSVESMKCGVEIVKCGVEIVKCRVWTVEWGVWSAECGVESVKCGVWSVECGGECGVKSVECGVWSGEWRVWSVEFGVWSVECGVWSGDCEVWSVKCGVESVKCGAESVKRLRLRLGSAHWALGPAVDLEGGGGGRSRRRRDAPLIQSGDPHLAVAKTCINQHVLVFGLSQMRICSKLLPSYFTEEPCSEPTNMEWGAPFSDQLALGPQKCPSP